MTLRSGHLRDIVLGFDTFEPYLAGVRYHGATVSFYANSAHVTCRLREDDSLSIDYAATTTAPTQLNLANHAYFNLSDDPTRSILGRRLTIGADSFTPVDGKPAAN